MAQISEEGLIKNNSYDTTNVEHWCAYCLAWLIFGPASLHTTRRNHGNSTSLSHPVFNYATSKCAMAAG
jgi:hypothetical protein